MRSVILVVLVAACTPEIDPGAYLCGPNKACPEGQTCSELDNTCVLPGVAEPFACEPDLASEPDDTADTGYVLRNLDCTTLPLAIDGCMLAGDTADWLQVTAPATCASIKLDTRITFPLAFERLGVELWDVAANQKVATDTECQFDGQGGDDLRCLAGTLTGGTTYGIQVAPTGEGDCNGDCAFNRYTLRIQLTAP